MVICNNHGSFCSDGRTLFFADSGGTVMGCLVPPKEGADTIENIRKKLQDLQHVSQKTASVSRGSFQIIPYGIQMGGGSKVSVHPHTPFILISNTQVPCPRFQLKCEKLATKAFFRDPDIKNHLGHVGGNAATLLRGIF
jgi:hypothetical protein